jgi:hypothetical protein
VTKPGLLESPGEGASTLRGYSRTAWTPGHASYENYVRINSGAHGNRGWIDALADWRQRDGLGTLETRLGGDH